MSSSVYSKSAADTATDATRSAVNKAADTASDTAKAVVSKVADTSRALAERTTEVTGVMQEATANVMQEATAKVEGFVLDTQKSMTEQFEKLSKGFEGFTAFGQDNMDALVKSSEIATKAAEGISSEFTAYSKKALEDGVAAAQDFASAKTMTELFEKQTTFAQTALEGWMHQATKMGEIYSAAAKDITAPIGQRVTAATEKMKTFAL